MIILSPYSSKLRNGANNPKNYPHWQNVVDMIISMGLPIVQVGVLGETPLKGTTLAFNLSLGELTDLVQNPKCKTWASVDNFFPHLCSHTTKPGVVVWSKSDPEIFGYKQNTNILKDRSYLRPDQFGFWHDCAYDLEAFVSPTVVVNEVLSKCN
jgi:hypothetical protein